MSADHHADPPPPAEPVTEAERLALAALANGSEAFEVADWLAPYFAALRPPDQRPIWEWAEDNFIVATGPKRGPWRLYNSPWVKRLLEKVQDIRVREFTCICAAQSSKTETMLLILAWVMAEDPDSTMWVTSAKDEAETVWIERIEPSLRAVPVIARKLEKLDRTRLKICEIHLPEMVLEAGGANSKRFLQSRTRRNLFLDEVRNWKPWALPMVMKRVRQFWNSRMMIITTAGTARDPSDRAFRRGSQEHYHVECPACHRRVSDLRFYCKKGERLSPFYAAEHDGGLMWDVNDTTCPGGKWDFDELKKTVRYQWPCCGAISHDTPPERRRIADDQNAEWVAHNPKAPPDKFSQTWSALLSVPWGNIVEEYLNAKDALETAGDIEPLKTFYQETLGIAWEERMRMIGEEEPLAICKAQYDVWALAPEGARDFMLIDVQAKGGRHYKWIVRRFLRGGGSQLRGWGVARSREEIIAEAERYKVAPANICFDTGYAATEIYLMLLESGYSEYTGTLWKGMKGEDAQNYKIGGINQPYRISEPIDPYHGTSQAGTVGQLSVILFSRAALLDRLAYCQRGLGPRWLIPEETPEGCPPLEDYIAEATSFKCVEAENRQGIATTKWVKPKGVPVDYTSCELMALVAAMGTNLFATPPPQFGPAPAPAADEEAATE